MVNHRLAVSGACVCESNISKKNGYIELEFY